MESIDILLRFLAFERKQIVHYFCEEHEKKNFIERRDFLFDFITQKKACEGKQNRACYRKKKTF